MQGCRNGISPSEAVVCVVALGRERRALGWLVLYYKCWSVCNVRKATGERPVSLLIRRYAGDTPITLKVYRDVHNARAGLYWFSLRALRLGGGYFQDSDPGCQSSELNGTIGESLDCHDRLFICASQLGGVEHHVPIYLFYQTDRD